MHGSASVVHLHPALAEFVVWIKNLHSLWRHQKSIYIIRQQCFMKRVYMLKNNLFLGKSIRISTDKNTSKSVWMYSQIVMEWHRGWFTPDIHTLLRLLIITQFSKRYAFATQKQSHYNIEHTVVALRTQYYWNQTFNSDLLTTNFYDGYWLSNLAFCL